MRYEWSGDTAVFLSDNPKSDSSSKRAVSFEGAAFDRTQIIRLLDAVCRYGSGKSAGTQINISHAVLKPFAGFLRRHKLTYPASSVDWQMLLIHFMHFYMTDRSDSQRSVRTRADGWVGSVSPVFGYLIEEEIIPYDVSVPRVDIRSELATSPVDAPLFGQLTRRTRHTHNVQKLLVDISFSQTDADYLTHVEQDCRSKLHAIRTACLTHWQAMRANHRAGKTLVAQLAPEEVDARVHERRYEEDGYHPPKITPPHLPDGHVWALAIVQRMLARGEDLNCVSFSALHSSPFFRSTGVNPNKGCLRHPALSKFTKLPALSERGSAEFYSFLGILSPLDAAAACCLLITDHPQFNPTALTDAQLVDAHGKLYLEATGTEGRFRFGVDKPRARSRKEAVLSPLAQEIVSDIIEATAPIRSLMRRTGHKGWRYLFLGANRVGRVGPFGALLVNHLTRSPISLISLYPELANHGLTRGSFDFRRLRNSVGVLRWFETGSVVEMSRSLGNTEQVALDHYLPPALLRSWNTRIIRRFQNTLIVLAAHQEDYLLEVTDLTTFADLMHFMGQLVTDHPKGSSPLGSEIHDRLSTRVSGPRSTTVGSEDRRKQLLNVRCSVQSLAYLYAFDQYLSDLTTSEREYTDPSTGLSPQAFVELSRMLHHACENPDVGAALHDQLDIQALRRLHEAALRQQKTLRAQFARFSLRTEWECKT